MRSPGGMQGLYANRPSTGAVDLDEVLPLCDEMDTAGVFARNAETWHTVIHAWYQNFTDYRRYPKRIYYPDSSFPDVSTDAGALLESFIVKLEKFLDTKREHVDISTHWESTHPTGAPSDISYLLNTVSNLRTYSPRAFLLQTLTSLKRHMQPSCRFINTTTWLFHFTQTMLRSMTVAVPSSTQDLWPDGHGVNLMKGTQAIM